MSEAIEGTPTGEVLEAKEVKEGKELKLAEPMAVVDSLPVPKDSKELGGFIEMISKGGAFPTRFETKEQRLAAYFMARNLMGEKWQLAINHIAVIKGQMTIWGEFPGALAEHTGEVQEKHTYLIDKDYNKICIENKNLDAEAWAGVCVIQRKGREKKEFTYTLDEAKAAGQYPAVKNKNGQKVPNPDSPWMKFTKVMLRRKAMALAVKFEFPDAFIGVPIAEFDHDEIPDMGSIKDVSSTSNEVEDLNKRYASSSKENPSPEPSPAG